MSKIKVNEISKHDSSEITINDTIKVDTISEKTSANGVTIDGVNLKDSVVKTDTISEKTSAAGVTIDGLLIKDGAIPSIAGGKLLQVTLPIISAVGDINFIVRLLSLVSHVTDSQTFK